MMVSRVYTVEGIILKRRNSGEADRILTVFTKQTGKIRVLAKGVRRVNSRRAGHIEVFSRVLLTLHRGKVMDLLTEAQQIITKGFTDSSITNVSYAYYLCELVDQLMPDGQEHEDIFTVLCGALSAVSQQQDEERLRVYINEFTHRLLWQLGYLEPSKRLESSRLRPFVESITERKSKTLLLLTKLHTRA
jgi:DNA repair protein RecO (recombination protein O)